MAKVQIDMQAKADQATAAFKQATSGIDDVSNALVRLIQQENATKALDAAAVRFKHMSEEEKQAAIAAYEYMNAQQKAADEAAAGSQQMAGGFKMAWTEFSSFLNVVERGLQAVSKVYDATIGETYDYALAVDKLGRTIGATAEESSKLIQAGDDLGISTEQITSMMEAAIRKGYRPTIEGLGQIADQYNAIQDPIAKSKFLMDTFGRSGADIAELMEKGSAGLKAMGDAAEAAGLTMGAQEIQAAKEYRAALDDVGDAWMGIKIKAGNAALPYVTELLNGASGKDTEKKSLFNHLKEVHDIQEATKAAAGVQADMNERLYGMRDAVDSIDFNKLDEGINIESGPARAAADEIERIRAGVDAFNSIDISFGSKIAGELDKIAFQQAGGDKIQAAFQGVKDAVNAGKITPEEAKGMYQELFVASEAVKVKMGEISSTQAAQNIQKELGGSLTDSKKKVDDIIKRLTDIPSHITTTLDIIVNQSGGTGTGDGGTGGGGGGNEPEVIGNSGNRFANYGVQNFTLTGKATLDSILREMRL